MADGRYFILRHPADWQTQIAIPVVAASTLLLDAWCLFTFKDIKTLLAGICHWQLRLQKNKTQKAKSASLWAGESFEIILRKSLSSV